MSNPFLPYYPSYGSPAAPTFPVPAQGLPELTNDISPTGDGKSVYNPPRPDGKRSEHYDTLWHGDRGPGSKSWWDFHVYHQPSNPVHKEYARKLYEAVRREFPEVRAYRFFDIPVGPHPQPMFEINVFNPEQLGALFSWFVANRGPCSVLVHPNSGNAVDDHTILASWMGEKVPLDFDMLRALEAKIKADATATSSA